MTQVAQHGRWVVSLRFISRSSSPLWHDMLLQCVLLKWYVDYWLIASYDWRTASPHRVWLFGHPVIVERPTLRSHAKYPHIVFHSSRTEYFQWALWECAMRSVESCQFKGLSSHNTYKQAVWRLSVQIMHMLNQISDLETSYISQVCTILFKYVFTRSADLTVWYHILLVYIQADFVVTYVSECYCVSGIFTSYVYYLFLVVKTFAPLCLQWNEYEVKWKVRLHVWN